MFGAWLAVCALLAVVMRLTQVRRQRAAEQEAARAHWAALAARDEAERVKAEKAERVRYDIGAELERLYLERDLLLELSDKLGYDSLTDLSASELKKAIAHERKITAVEKRIHALETKRLYL